jgi:hypothetical protein
MCLHPRAKSQEFQEFFWEILKKIKYAAKSAKNLTFGEV